MIEPAEKSMRFGTKTRRPEEELLLLCCRVRRDSEVADCIRTLLQESVDWKRLLRLAGEHRMMPLLHWHLSAASPELVQQEVLNRLQSHFYTTHLRNLSSTGELLRLVRTFREQDVPLIAYKGPVLASLAYGNLALREFIDLDVLVRKRDIPEARRLLVSAGYRQIDPPTGGYEAALLQSQREYVFIRDGILVELHWAVTPRNYSFPLDAGGLWERLQHVPLGGEKVATFSMEDLLLILCVHGSKHFWHRLAWICDVAELLRTHATIDWEQLMYRADELGSKRMLFLGLLLADELLEAPLPEKVSRMVRTDPKATALARQVREWLFQEPDGSPNILAKGRLDESRFHPFRVRMRERLRDKFGYAVRTALIPTPEDWQYLRLPESLFFLYYLVRPIRLTARYGQRLSRRTDR